MSAYSAFKAAWHLDDIAALRAKRNIVPRQVLMVISDLCNQDCAFCTHRSETGWARENFGADTGRGFTMNPNRMIPTGKAFEILEDFASLGVRAVQFTGGGEPTVHPEHNAIFRKALDLGLQVGLITNGARLPDPDVLARMTWVRVSVDAGKEETYSRIRKSRAWPRVMENVARLAALGGPTFGCGFVTTKDNAGEIAEFARRMKGFGVPYVKISAALSTEGAAYYDGLLDLIAGQTEELSALADDSFRVVNVFSRRLADLRIGRPVNAFCGHQRFAGYIGGDLKVYRCCNTAYTTRGEIGDLRGATYREWLDKQSQKAFDGFDARGCSHCQFHEANELVAYLVNESPLHVDFV